MEMESVIDFVLALIVILVSIMKVNDVFWGLESNTVSKCWVFVIVGLPINCPRAAA